MAMLLTCPECQAMFRVSEGALGESGRRVRCSACANEWFAEPYELRPEGFTPSPPPTETETFDPAEENVSGEEENPFANMHDATPQSDNALPYDGGMPRAPEGDMGGEEEKEDLFPVFVDSQPEKARRASFGMVCVLLLSMVISAISAAAAFRDAVVAKVPALEKIYDMAGLDRSKGVKLADLALNSIRINARKTRYEIRGVVVNVTGKPQVLPAVRIRLLDKKGKMLREWELAQKGRIAARGRRNFTANKLDSLHGGKEARFVVDIGSGYELSLRD